MGSRRLKVKNEGCPKLTQLFSSKNRSKAKAETIHTRTAPRSYPMQIARLLFAMCALALAAADLPCDEKKLQQDAIAVLESHVDPELGGVGAGARDIVGFQYLKPAEALVAAQALAHNDFDRAAAQVQRILHYQKPNGLLPHLVYGPSVPYNLQWIPSNRTFHPGPAFWHSAVNEQQGDLSMSLLNTSTISAPPIAGDVAWEIFRLAPYDSVLGVSNTAVQFLCHVYEPLKKLLKHLYSTRGGPAPNSLLMTYHPWETFSSLSPHWKAFLADLKNAPDYEEVISSIPEKARSRFAAGSSTIFSTNDAVKDMYEPMVYLAAQTRLKRGEVYSSKDGMLASIARAASGVRAASFGVEDVEFNAFVLRSTLALVNIGHVLIEHSSVCTKFVLTQKELLNDLEEMRAMAGGLEKALNRLWNTSADFFADSSRWSWSSFHSLRGFLPGYAVNLDDDKKMRSMKHILAEPSSFSFYCTKYPASFFACSEDNLNLMDDRPAITTWIIYNYFLQRNFVRNKFPGLADYIRNKTREMVCEATIYAQSSLPWSAPKQELAPTALALAYYSRDAGPVQIFDDSYNNSTMAAAALLNILLPAVTPPPSPDTPPIDHRILSIIMCVELIVAFGVAMSCFLFSVYFVANRPRNTRLSPASAARRRQYGAAAKKSRDRADRSSEDSNARSSASMPLAGQFSVSSSSNSSPRSGHTLYELKDPLISEEDERYGSFDGAEQRPKPSNAAWKAAKKVLADISPW